jgi:hypothetical protein
MGILLSWWYQHILADITVIYVNLTHSVLEAWWKANTKTNQMFFHKEISEWK